jgi:hypothetical protein
MKLATTNTVAAVLAAATFAGPAMASVKHEGAWPSRAKAR